MVVRSVGGGVGLVGLAAGGGRVPGIKLPKTILSPTPSSFLVPHFGWDSIRVVLLSLKRSYTHTYTLKVLLILLKMENMHTVN